MMVFGMSAGVYAAVHVHAYSYMGDQVTVTSNVGSHYFNQHNPETGQMETVICYISAKTEHEVWKCACGARENRNGVTRTFHSACGL